ncbi:MAG TPA: glycosyltransferase family 4 protein [Flavobacteriales bacterium]|jgi:hypothetical protein|nr:glycosyltransferase family 4 protein [Flavobacteriales bacterium]
MTKLLFITYYWPPSGGPGVQRGLKFVKYLPGEGVQPIVLTVDPAQASYPIIDQSLQADVPAEVRVVRTRSFEPLRLLASVMGKEAVPHSGFAGSAKPGPLQKAMRWVRGNWMIPDARRGWVRHAVRAAARIIAEDRIDTILVSSPPHSSQLIGLELKKRFPHLRWIADLRDPWTDIYFAKELMKGAAASRRDAAWEARVLREADAVVVVGPSMQQLFAQRYGADVARRIHVVPNGYDGTDLKGLSAHVSRSGTFRITYVGSMAGSYAPEAFFAAVRSAQQRSTARIELRFVGGISPEVKEAADKAGVNALCTWVPAVPHAEAVREMADADLLLLVVPHVDGEEHIITGKVFEYLATERPILAIGPVHGDAAAIVAECAAGRTFDRSMTEAITEHLVDLIARAEAGEDLRVQGRIHVRYERHATTAQLARLVRGDA